MGLNDLPNELLFCIADTLPYTWDISSLCLVNRHFNDVFGKYLWMFNKQYDRQTTMTWAATYGSEMLVQRLVEEELASGRLAQYLCDELLADSIDHGRVQIAEYLFDVRSRIPGPHEQARSQEEIATLLLRRAAQADGATVRVLLEKGADLYKPPRGKLWGLSICIGPRESVVDVVLDWIQYSGHTDPKDLTNFLYSELIFEASPSHDHCILRFCKGLLKLGADLNAQMTETRPQDQDSHIGTIGWAIRSGLSNTIHYLLEQGVNPCPLTPDQGRLRPFWYAINCGYSDLASAMLEYANSDEIIADGKEICELFLIAAYCGSQSIVDKLLARCCRQETPGLFTPDDMSKALLNAAKRGHGHIVEILLAHGAKPESSIFVAAIRGGSAEVVKLLIDAGVNVDEPRGTSSLFLAVGSESIFRLLLERGADPKLCSDRMKLLTAVILTGNLAQLQELLNRVPLERITYWDESNSLMILNAALGAGRAVMEFIFDHVLQFVQQDAGRLSPVLYQAASLAHWNSFEFLLEKGVPPPNGEDLNNTINSIFLRSKIDQAEHLIDLLKCNGAKIETEGDCGTKALRNSMYNRCKPAIRFFLDRAANPVALLQSIRFERTSVFSQDSEIIPGSQVLLEASLQRLSHEERKERMKELKSEATSRQEWKTLRILQRSECQFGLFSLLD